MYWFFFFFVIVNVILLVFSCSRIQAIDQVVHIKHSKSLIIVVHCNIVMIYLVHDRARVETRLSLFIFNNT